MPDDNEQGRISREVSGQRDLVPQDGLDCNKLFLLSKLRAIEVFQAEGGCYLTLSLKRWLMQPQRRTHCSWAMVGLRRAEEAIAPVQANDGGSSAQGGGN